MEATKVCCLIHHWSGVHRSNVSVQGDAMDEELLAWVGSKARQVQHAMWQPKCYSPSKESNISLSLEAHRHSASLDTRSSWREAHTSHKGTHRRKLVRLYDQGITDQEVWRSLQRHGHDDCLVLNREGGDLLGFPSLAQVYQAITKKPKKKKYLEKNGEGWRSV